MTCSKCGALNPNSRAYCKSCGTSLWPILKATASTGALAVAAGAPSPVSVHHSDFLPHPVSNVELSAEVSKFYGVRGWLLYFCILQTVISPALLIAEAVKSKSAPTIAIDIALTALCICTGAGLWRRSANCLDWVEVFFMAQLILVMLCLLGAIVSKSGYMGRDLSTDSYVNLGMQSLGSLIIWWAYFKKSKRVKATYGRNL